MVLLSDGTLKVVAYLWTEIRKGSLIENNGLFLLARPGASENSIFSRWVSPYPPSLFIVAGPLKKDRYFLCGFPYLIKICSMDQKFRVTTLRMLYRAGVDQMNWDKSASLIGIRIHLKIRM